MRPAKRLVFLLVTLVFPVAFFGAAELLLRVARYDGSPALFDRPAKLHGKYLVPARNIGARYFPRDPSPPSPSVDAFLADKPRNVVRIFVLGESVAAGFPYSANAAFSNALRYALQDVLPLDTVEVVNLAIAATNTFTIADLAKEVIARQPDAVLIYAGHNEYYGALGAGSTESLGQYPGFVRLYLRLQRFRTFLLLRNLVAAVTARPGSEISGLPPASRMETVVRDVRITLGGETYLRGIRQFGSNLQEILATFADAHVPVFIGSTPSNLRDLRPFGSVRRPSANAAFDSARTALSRGDTPGAARLFALARDLDVIRFRAPGDFSRIVRAVSARPGAHYVPVEERFKASAKYGIPGSDLFLEHVHPTSHGQVLIAREYFEAIRRAGFLGRRSDTSRLAHWDEYERRLPLTELDHLIAGHVVRSITSRWPFVPAGGRNDYRREYRSSSYVDSLAFEVSVGRSQWSSAKLELGERLFAGGHPGLAALEYKGLIGREPHSEAAYRLAGRALLAAGDTAQARDFIQRAQDIEPSAFSSFVLGVLAVEEKKLPQAAALLEQSLKLGPDTPATLHQLSLTYALSGELQRARALAMRLATVQPAYPGLEAWLAALGIRRR